MAIDNRAKRRAHQVEDLSIRARVPVILLIRKGFELGRSSNKFSAEGKRDKFVGLPDSVLADDLSSLILSITASIETLQTYLGITLLMMQR